MNNGYIHCSYLIFNVNDEMCATKSSSTFVTSLTLLSPFFNKLSLLRRLLRFLRSLNLASLFYSLMINEWSVTALQRLSMTSRFCLKSKNLEDFTFAANQTIRPVSRHMHGQRYIVDLKSNSALLSNESNNYKFVPAKNCPI